MELQRSKRRKNKKWKKNGGGVVKEEKGKSKKSPNKPPMCYQCAIPTSMHEGARLQIAIT